MARPYTTLFLLQSLDGKISTGENDSFDVDKDFPKISGVKEGLFQYYDIEKTTDTFSFNSGKVMAKIGLNTKDKDPEKIGCSFIIVDNKPHLNSKGVEYLSKWVKHLFLVTTNADHPALQLQDNLSNITVIKYEKNIIFSDLFTQLKEKYSIDRLTLQSGGTLNSELLRGGLIDEVSIVIAPCLIGGENTQSLIGGPSLKTEDDLSKIKSLKLISSEVLENSYLHLRYTVNN